MKRTIAIVAGGDSSELVVSLRSAQGLYSFIDKERYNLYIVEMEGHRWEVVLPDGSKTPIDRNDFSFMENGEKKQFDFAYITIHGLNASGKTIGVISHVEAMKERIPVQIKVKKINGLGYSKLESTFAVK